MPNKLLMISRSTEQRFGSHNLNNPHKQEDDSEAMENDNTIWQHTIKASPLELITGKKEKKGMSVRIKTKKSAFQKGDTQKFSPMRFFRPEPIIKKIIDIPKSQVKKKTIAKTKPKRIIRN